jgi:tetratricopeptide (TPR) repeat protein
MKYLTIISLFLILSCNTKTAQDYYNSYQQSFKKEYFNKAAEYLSLAIEKNSENPLYFMLRSDCYARLEKYKEAIKDLNVIVEHGGGTVLVFYNRGIFKINIKDYEGAIADFESAYMDQPYIDCFYQIGRAYNLNGDFTKAIESLNKEIEKDSTIGCVFNERGFSYWQIGLKKMACSDWKKAASLNDEDAIKNLELYCKDKGELNEK